MYLQPSRDRKNSSSDTSVMGSALLKFTQGYDDNRETAYNKGQAPYILLCKHVVIECRDEMVTAKLISTQANSK